MQEIEHIEDLVGEKFSGVGFVMDYVEFYFSGPVLRCLADPSIKLLDGYYRFPELGSRDALCKLIGSTVVAVTIEEGKSMNLQTSEGTILSVQLADGSRWGSETMHFVPKPNGPVQVW